MSFVDMVGGEVAPGDYVVHAVNNVLQIVICLDIKQVGNGTPTMVGWCAYRSGTRGWLKGGGYSNIYRSKRTCTIDKRHVPDTVRDLLEPKLEEYRKKHGGIYERLEL